MARTPERFVVRGRPVVALPPNSVAINPTTHLAMISQPADCVNFPDADRRRLRENRCYLQYDCPKQVGHVPVKPYKKGG